MWSTINGIMEKILSTKRGQSERIVGLGNGFYCFSSVQIWRQKTPLKAFLGPEVYSIDLRHVFLAKI